MGRHNQVNVKILAIGCCYVQLVKPAYFSSSICPFLRVA